MTSSARSRRGCGCSNIFILIFLTALLILLNVTGAAPLPGGPLGESFLESPLNRDPLTATGLRGGPTSGAFAGSTVYESELVLANSFPVPAQLVRITPINPVGGISIVSVTTLANPPVIQMDLQARLPVAFAAAGAGTPITNSSVDPYVSAAKTNWVQVLIALTAPAGVSRISGFVLDYRVGPVSFRTIWRHEVYLCLPPVGGSDYTDYDCHTAVGA